MLLAKKVLPQTLTCMLVLGIYDFYADNDILQLIQMPDVGEYLKDNLHSQGDVVSHKLNCVLWITKNCQAGSARQIENPNFLGLPKNDP